MAVEILYERMFCKTEGSNPRPSEYQADAHKIELLGPAIHVCTDIGN